MHIYKMSEWESGAGGAWYCNDIEDLGNNSGVWWHPARILDIPPSDLVKLLIDKYKVDNISYNYENNVLIYSWKSQAEMRKFKNFINQKAREKNYRI